MLQELIKRKGRVFQELEVEKTSKKESDKQRVW